jgi:hypothetical protein
VMLTLIDERGNLNTSTRRIIVHASRPGR